MDRTLVMKALDRVERKTLDIEKKTLGVPNRYMDVVAQFDGCMDTKDRLIHWVYALIDPEYFPVGNADAWADDILEIIEKIENTDPEAIDDMYHHLIGSLGLQLSDDVAADICCVNLTLINERDSADEYSFHLPSDDDNGIVSYDMTFRGNAIFGIISEDVWTLLIYYIIDVVYSMRVFDVVDLIDISDSTRRFLRYNSNCYYLFRLMSDDRR